MNRSITALLILILVLSATLSGASAAAAIEAERDWATADTAHFRVHASGRADVGQIGRVAEAIYEGMAPRYGYVQAEKTDLYIYTDRSIFLKESPSSGAVGYASPRGNYIAILQGVGNSTVTLAHEINHIIFMTSVPRIDTVPQWFIEGLAIYESQPGVEAARLEKYALARDVPDLADRKGDTDGPAELSDYAQGSIMVSFIADKYGRTGLYGVIGRLQSGEDFNTALMQALGRSQEQLNAEWKEYARGRLLQIWLIQLRDIGWYIMTILIIAAIIIVPLRRRRRLREMEDEEEVGETVGEGVGRE